MNWAIRIVAAIGLVLLAAIVVPLPFTPLIVDDASQAYLDASFYTTCKLLGNAIGTCQTIKTILGSALIGSAISIAIFNLPTSLAIAALALVAWTVFYANPMLDKSNKNVMLFMQAGVGVAGLLVSALRK